MKNKLVIVAGSSGSGKSTIAKTILESVKAGNAQIICLDRFYLKDKKSMPKVESSDAINYDHPDSFEWKLVIKCLKELLENKSTILPSYDYVVQARKTKGDKIKPTKLIILEGTLPLVNNELRKLADLKIYVDTPLDECFIRRLQRDNVERGRSVKSVIKQWKEAVKPMYVQYVEPSKVHADLVLPWEKVNISGIEVLTRAIRSVVK